MNGMPLDSWTLGKIGADGAGLTREALGRYQLGKFRETIEYARTRSPFYRRLLSGLPADFPADFSQVGRLPLTTAGDIRENPLQFLARPPHAIARIVTLRTSGTTGRPKRLYFTEEDLERTVDFFSVGMSMLARPGHKVLILLPGDRPDSVGDLLARALARIGVEGIAYGPVRDLQDAARQIVSRRIDCLVGIPTQVLALARSRAGRLIPPDRIRTVLLSTDYVPEAIVRELCRRWGCRVFRHYGTTEMGLGGGVECPASSGYHLREADLLFEIVDPGTGEPRAEGRKGEIVVSTLTRKGMPLIRYRTGDISRMIPGPCRCGSVTRRLDAVLRMDGRAVLSNGSVLSMPEMDEALFGVCGLLDYRAALSTRDHRDCLEISVYTEDRGESVTREALRALVSVPPIAEGLAEGSLRLAPVGIRRAGWFTTGVAKRSIADSRNRTPKGRNPQPVRA